MTEVGENAWPTPAQWVDRFLGWSRAEQEAAAVRVMESQQAAGDCFQRNHVGVIRELEARLAHPARGSSGMTVTMHTVEPQPQIVAVPAAVCRRCGARA